MHLYLVKLCHHYKKDHSMAQENVFNAVNEEREASFNTMIRFHTNNVQVDCDFHFFFCISRISYSEICILHEHRIIKIKTKRDQKKITIKLNVGMGAYETSTPNTYIATILVESGGVHCSSRKMIRLYFLIQKGYIFVNFI